MEAKEEAEKDNVPFKCEEEMAKLQKMSAEYQPETKGLLVSDAITEEYAQADPIYVEKTVHLKDKFFHYRTVRGDGNCGWKAIVFSYFEPLPQSAKGPLLASELRRIKNLTTTMEVVGWDAMMTEDFAAETVTLL